MLSTLRIRRIGVIDDALLEFGPGFTALTGETGAGKTMVVTGLAMLLGARLDRGRTGAAASVDGTIRLAGHEELARGADELGAEEEDGEILVSRRVTKDGRSRAHVGGVPVPISTLTGLVGSAVTIHGQQDQQRLRDADPQREALDRYAGEAVEQPRTAHERLWQEHRALHAEVEHLAELLRERDLRGAALEEALTALEELDPQPGEDEELRAEIARLAHAVDLRAAAEQAGYALVGEDDGPAAGALLDVAVECMSTAARTDPTLEPLLERAEAARIDVSDIAAELSRYAEGIDAAPGRVEEANQRLHELTALVRRIGPALGGAADITELLEASQRAAADVDRYAGAQARHAEATARLAALDEQLEDAARTLTAARTEAARSLAAAVQEELRQLEMPQARIRIDVTEQAPRAHGRDRIAFLLSPHPGAEHLPVATAASGGELSRVMLALEVALASSRADRTAAPVFVFDEIDAGIGGRAAVAVGHRLAQLARHAQVIVVTHLPQVAACATTHLQIAKISDADADTTSSTVRSLPQRERVVELARMLAGDAESDLALAHAEELLRDAQAAAP